MDEHYEWHIGGDSLFAVSRVVEALGMQTSSVGRLVGQADGLED
jgi:hypothetical protein